MERKHSNRSSSRQSGSGLPMVVLALLLIAIAAAIDIAWMAPGQATPTVRAEQVVTPEQAAAAADAMAAAHHAEKVSSSALGTQSGTN
jgi:hypothetical protein